MSEEQKLRDRIEWLKTALAGCQDDRLREGMIQRLLDTQDQLMFLKLGEPRRRVPVPLRAI